MNCWTATSLLHELASARGAQPTYQLERSEGQAHKPTFVFKCCAGRYNGIGTGVSKKSARMAAAYNALREMSKVSGELSTKELELFRRIATPEASPEVDNPVGQLLELCHRRLWPPPSFEFECAVDGEFQCSVQLGKWSRMATGQAKRLAKREAAAAMLQLIDSIDKIDGAASLDIKGPLALSEEQFQRLTESKKLQTSAKAGSEVDRLFQGIRNRKGGEGLPAIKPETAENAFEQLRQLASTHNFNFAFLKEAEKTGELYSCQLKLNTMPTIVSAGIGPNSQLCRELACRAALDYLCQATKDS